MIVEITSLVPKNALKTPAIPDQIAPHNAPHKMEPMIEDDAGQGMKMQCENDCTEPAHKILTRPADVKESGFAGNGKTKPSQKQRRHVAQRFADGINIAECAANKLT